MIAIVMTWLGPVLWWGLLLMVLGAVASLLINVWIATQGREDNRSESLSRVSGSAIAIAALVAALAYWTPLVAPATPH
ncbi:MAG: hypothetical protein ABL864_10970 [Terricaulis sp.]